MLDQHKYPSHIFTTCLSISHIFISHKNSHVMLLGCYGCLIDGEFNTIEIRTSFQVLNELLSEVEEADEVIEILSKSISNPTTENETIDIGDSGGITFDKHFFSLTLIYNEDENGNTIVPNPEDISYWLNYYIKFDESFATFIDYCPPKNKTQLTEYFNRILCMQYKMYLSIISKGDKEKGLIFSNLSNPIYFAMAKTQFELDK